MKNLIIKDKTISENSKPFIIAEIGVNYYDIATKEKIEPIEAAKLMIKEAAESGTDAVKFQSYKADKLVSKNSPAYWDTEKESTKSQFELFKKYDKFGEDEYKELAKYANLKNTVFMSTPFDIEAADYLNDFMDVFKISSSDITNIPFIHYISKMQKPILLSTGASTVKEITEAVSSIEEEGNKQIVPMHCILNYPTKYEDANLGMIKHIKQLFPEYLVGYSDHTLPDSHMIILTASFLFGARVIEKHFTLDKTLYGNDHYHSMDSKDLKNFIGNLELLYLIKGSNEKKPLENEFFSRQYARRSLVAKIIIPKGTKIGIDDITWKRPGTGIPPDLLKIIVGSTALEDIAEDEILTFEKISLKGENK